MAPPWRDGHSHMVNQEHLSSLTSALKAMEANTPRRRCVVSTRRVVLVALCAYPRLSVTILSALQLPHNRHRRRCPWRAGAMHWAQYDGGALGGTWRGRSGDGSWLQPADVQPTSQAMCGIV